MNTKSIIYALSIVLPAILFAGNITAQVKFASQGNYSSASRDKYFTTASLNFYRVAEPDFHRLDIAIMPYSSPLPARDNNIAEKPDFLNNEVRSISLMMRLTENKFTHINLERLKIGFKRTSFSYPVNPGKDIGVTEYSEDKLILYAVALKQYAVKNGFDTTYAFLSNMGILNSKKRFFVVNLVTLKVEESGLVAQGRGTGPTRFDKQYSNVKESKCTSLGRYRITNKYKGEYGESYRMIGLDSTNCNAFKRNIVLHPMGCIPDAEEENMPVCISEGCPAVSVNFLSYLSNIIDSRKKSVLLWVFDSNLEEIILDEDSINLLAGDEDEKKRHSCTIHRVGEANKPDL